MSIQMKNVKAITLGGQSVKKIEKNGVVLWQESGSGDNGKWDFSNGKTNSIMSSAEHPIQFKSLISNSSNYISIANGEVLSATCKISYNLVDTSIDPELVNAYIGIDDGTVNRYSVFPLAYIESTNRLDDIFDLNSESYLWCGTDLENVDSVEFATTQYGVTLTYKDSSNNILMTITFSDIEYKIKTYTETSPYFPGEFYSSSCGANENTYYTGEVASIKADLTKRYALRTRVSATNIGDFRYTNNNIFVGFDLASGKLGPSSVRLDRDVTVPFNAFVANNVMRIGIKRSNLVYDGTETIDWPGTGSTLAAAGSHSPLYDRFRVSSSPSGTLDCLQLDFDYFKVLTWDKE